MARTITAKVRCTWIQSGDLSSMQSGASVVFTPDYQDPANQDWASSTPALNLSMVVKDRDLFEAGQKYTLTFTPED